MSPSSSAPTPRDRLIAIALQLLDRHHPEDLSLREVARQAGLTSGAPAHHFGNKLGLLAACAEVAWSNLCARMEAAGAGTTPQDGIRAKAQAYVNYALSNPGPYRLMTSRLFEPGDQFESISAYRTRAMAGVVDLVQQHRQTDDPAFGWRRGLAMWALLHGHVSLVLDGAIADEKVDWLTQDICQMAPAIALF